MNAKILLLASGVAVLSSCTTAYRSAQTPDDVYFSPAREQPAYVNTEQYQDRDNYRSYGNSAYSDYDYNDYRDDRFLRLRVGNRMRWFGYDDFYWNDYAYNRLDYGLSSPWNSYFYWNNFYNPYRMFYYTNPWYHPGFYGGGGVIINPKTPTVGTMSRPRAFNPGSYANNMYMERSLDASTPAARKGTYQNNSTINNSNGRRTSGDRYYNNSNNSNSRYNSSNDSYYNNSRSNNSYSSPSRSNDSPVRTYNPGSSSSGSSGGSSGGSGGGSSRPGRGN